MTRFEQLLSDPYAARRYLVEVAPYDPAVGAEVLLYYSDHGFTTEPDDTPANQHFEARVVEALNFQRSLYQPGAIGGQSLPDFGEIRLDNSDGGLDPLRRMAFDGRTVLVRLGGDDFRYDEYGLIFSGTAQSAVVDEEAVVLRLRDLQGKLTQPVPQALYTGAANGDEDDGLDLLFQLAGHATNEYLYVKLDDAAAYTVQDGDELHYEVLWPRAGAQPKNVAVDFVVALAGGGNQTLRGSAAMDQNGLASHPSTDLRPHASGTWYERRIPLPAVMVGGDISTWYVASEHDSAVPVNIRGSVRNIEIRGADGTVQYQPWDPTSGTLPTLSNSIAANPASTFGGSLLSANGRPELEGRPVPLCFGLCRNVTPVFINAQTTTFQVHDGEVLSIDEVYDSGNPVASFTAYPERGTFTINHSITGPDRITADVRGDSAAGYVDTPAGITRRLVEEHGPTDEVLVLDDASFTELDAEAPFPMGIYLSDQQELQAVLDDVLGSVGGYYGFLRDGRLEVGRFKTPDVYAAVTLDGFENFVAVDGLTYDRDDYQELTVEAWIKTESVNKHIASWDRSEYWRLAVGAIGTAQQALAFQYYDPSLPGARDLAGSATVNDGRWHHVAVVFDYGELRFYVDGELDASFTVGPTFGKGAGVVRYGFWGIGSEATEAGGAYNAGYEYAGEIRDGRIWSVARSQGEIQAGRWTPPDVPQAGLDGYWPFNDGVGSMARDLSGNGYHGTVLKSAAAYEGSWNAVAVFTPADILDLEAEAVELPSWRQRVEYRRSWTVQSTDSLAGGVDEDHRAFVGEASRLAVAEDAGVKRVHLLAQDPDPVPTLLDEKADAEAEAARLQELYGVDRELYRVTVKTQPFRLELGDAVRVDYPRFGLDAGRVFCVVGLEEEADVNRVTLELWG